MHRVVKKFNSVCICVRSFCRVTVSNTIITQIFVYIQKSKRETKQNKTDDILRIRHSNTTAIYLPSHEFNSARKRKTKRKPNSRYSSAQNVISQSTTTAFRLHFSIQTFCIKNLQHCLVGMIRNQTLNVSSQFYFETFVLDLNRLNRNIRTFDLQTINTQVLFVLHLTVMFTVLHHQVYDEINCQNHKHFCLYFDWFK